TRRPGSGSQPAPADPGGRGRAYRSPGAIEESGLRPQRHGDVGADPSSGDQLTSRDSEEADRARCGSGAAGSVVQRECTQLGRAQPPAGGDRLPQGLTARKMNALNTIRCTAPCNNVARPVASESMAVTTVSANSTISLPSSPSTNGPLSQI